MIARYWKEPLRTPLRPRHPAELPFAELEYSLDQQGERRSGYGSREQGHVVVEREPRGDALAVAARAYERGDGGGADVDDRGSLDAGEDRRQRERHFDEPKPVARLEAQGHRRLPHAADDAGEPSAGVADDRQQRVEEKRYERRPGADRARQRDEESEERERRDRLDHAHRSENRLLRLRQLRRRDAERHAEHDARGERHEHEQQVLAREPQEIRTEQRAKEIPPGRALRSAFDVDKRRCFGEALSFQLRRRVHADHAPLVDPPLELLKRAPGFGKAHRQLEPVKEHRLVARKIFPVVLEHAKFVALDLGVGGIDVHDIDLAGGDRFVSEAVIETRGCRVGQPVRGLQSRPTVPTADEFLRQAELQARVPREVRERADPERLRAVLAHRERVSVVEAEPHRDTEALRREGVIEIPDARITVDLEDLPRDRPRVFGVEVDRAGLARGEHDAGVAEARSVLDGDFAFDRPAQHLAEDVGLGKALGADAQRVGVHRQRDEQREEREEPRHSTAAGEISPRNCSAASLAYKPSSRTSSECVPAAITRPWSMTTMRSAFFTVARRCATMSVVRPRIRCSSAFCTVLSLSASSELVASSRSSTTRSASSARAIDRRWRLPPGRRTPRSPRNEFMPSGKRSMNSLA